MVKSGLREAGLGELVSSIITRVKPTPSELARSRRYSEEIIDRLKSKAPRGTEIIVAGSAARGTEVRGSHDIDIFMLFPRDISEEEMETRGIEIAKSIVDKGRKESYVIKYAEHPYMKLYLASGFGVDIVPAFKIDSARQMGSAVDRTPLHNAFIAKHLSTVQRDHVRVLKALLKSHGIYGAEARVHGFSGYLCELMVLQYGSFEGVVKRLVSLKLPVVIDVKGRREIRPDTGDGAAMLKHFKSDFVVIDPTDEARNVAASVSINALSKFVLVSRALIAHPNIATFYGAKRSGSGSLSVSKINRNLGTDLYVIALGRDDIADDIVWEQLDKLRLSIAELLGKKGFPVLLSFGNMSTNSCVMAFMVNPIKMKATLAGGPSAFMGDAVESFLDAHKGSLAVFLKDGRLVSLERAVQQDVEHLLRSVLSNHKLPSHIACGGWHLYKNNVPLKYAKLVESGFDEGLLHAA
ncbi:MAG: CCA tRNA nucleotidyltransferase [Candidatus Marsarchaeota archaeon]|jgi:tRNA nucleotidyltransferase (CCA-adding enzyme)|nr:CCA tRNA nucleotidyltransferase [Candidatus Marsarchaeota archaeon]